MLFSMYETELPLHSDPEQLAYEYRWREILPRSSKVVSKNLKNYANQDLH